MDPSHPGRTSSSITSGASFFSRNFTRRDSTRGDVVDESPKGPIGLTTLHDPGEVAVADLVFVHGLNGGSQSTWCKNGEVSLFWPSEWLPKDEAFQDVRIHTFGYASGLSRESVLNVPDFAQSLLSSIHDSPCIAPGTEVPVILVGHSMGGLVIKKAFILGHQTPEFRPLVRKVFALFFLATPHQGAGLADTIGRLLSLAPGSRPFVHDLSPASPVLQSINEEFPKYSDALQLFSFFENKPMNIGIGTQLIVEKHCAVLNYSNERRTYLNANHRDVARFTLRSDPSYLAIRNTLATTIASKRTSLVSNRRKAGYEQVEKLIAFLGIAMTPEDELESQDLRFAGTCDWFLEKSSFKQWRNASISKTLWLRGRPGAGKSVLSVNIIKHLQELGHDCCFYFFARGDKANATINSFLRSMAWQMSVQHPKILGIILQIAANFQASAVNKVDHVQVWRQLYLNGMLKIRLDKPQYWVVDALDECKGGSELMALLAKMQELWPLCLLVTSRDSVDRIDNSTSSRIEVIPESIEEDDTTRDIALLLKSKQDQLPRARSAERDAMVEQILGRSKGCFLWVTLVLKELRQVHTSTEIRKVLSTNTTDMDKLYARILSDMADARFGKELAKAILTWTTFSFRFLTTDELHCAIELDIEDKVDNIERSISSCCGNLVYVDKAKKVQLLHLTVRDFLTREGMKSEFKIDRADAHRRIALVCLRYLTSSEMRASTSRKLSVTQMQQRPVLANYACKYVFQHVFQTSSTDNEVLAMLSKFLGSESVLTWIEHLAISGDLDMVFHAGKTTNNLLSRLAQHSPVIGLRKELSILQDWGSDLIHLVTKFGKELSFLPSSIHRLIPPFCPRDSALNRQFSSPHRGLSVHGQSSDGWHDCLSIVNYTKPARPITIATCQNLFALGISSGKVMVYDDITCQETNALNHCEPVWALAFNADGTMIASAGLKNVRVWDPSNGNELFNYKIPAMCLSVTFAEEGLWLFATLKNNELRCWDIGSSRDQPKFTANWTTESDELSHLQYRQPTLTAFDESQHLLAIVYRGEDIILWDYERDHVRDVYEKETGSTRLNGPTKVSVGSTTVWDIKFTNLGEDRLLIATYSDGDIVCYNTLEGKVRDLLPEVNAQRLSCSSDGRTLACANSLGTIQLYDLETTKLLYRLDFEGDAISPRALAFSSDNHRIIDIRANQCRMWDPAVLQRQDLDEENSDTVSVSTAPLEVSFHGVNLVHITSIETVSSASVVFCGKEDGSVHAYDIAFKPASSELFVQTQGVSIAHQHFIAEKALLACSDLASRITLRRVRKKSRGVWDVDDPIIDTRVGLSITGIFSSAQQSRLLVSTDKEVWVWSTSGGNHNEPLLKRQVQESGHWLQSGVDSEIIILLCASSAYMYRWSTLECSHKVQLSNLVQPFTAISRAITLHHPRYFAASAIDPSRVQSLQNTVRIYDFNDFNLNSPAVDCTQYLGTLSSMIDMIIGVLDDRLVFLDTNNWICSIGISNTETTHTRHFFIPNDWVSLVHDLNMGINTNGDIIFVKRAELLIIKRGLEMTDQGEYTPRKRSLSPRSAIFGSRGGFSLRSKSH